MNWKNKDFEKRFRADMVPAEELKEYLVRNYSVFELADELSSYLIEDNLLANNRIILSPKQEELLKIMFDRIARRRYVDKGRKPVNAKTLAERESLDAELFK